MIKVSAEELLERGAHFGHQSKRWNPKMGQYLYGEEGGVHVFDLIKTKKLLEEALEFLKNAAEEKKSILFVGCKKQAQEKPERWQRQRDLHILRKDGWEEH